MIRLFLFLLLLPASWLPALPAKPIALFDGRTFRGWEGDTTSTWHIIDGALVGGSLTTQVPHNNFLCTQQPYGNFELRAQVKLEGTGFVNGGIQFRSQRAQKPDYEMVGYQADMGDNYWGCLYDESRRNKVLTGPDSTTLRRLVHRNDWNDYRLRCEGRHIQIWLNGEQTVDYTETDPAIPQTGIIGLQIHGGGRARAWFRNLRLEEL